MMWWILQDLSDGIKFLHIAWSLSHFIDAMYYIVGQMLMFLTVSCCYWLNNDV